VYLEGSDIVNQGYYTLLKPHAAPADTKKITAYHNLERLLVGKNAPVG
jgi:hypothetical protein